MKTSHSLLAISLVSLSQQAAAVSCTNLESWLASKAYNGGSTVQHEQKAYKANWWNQNKNPAQYSNPYQEWTKQGDCDSVVANKPPQISLTAPAAGSNHTAGTAVTLSASSFFCIVIFSSLFRWGSGHQHHVEMFLHAAVIVTAV